MGPGRPPRPGAAPSTHIKVRAFVSEARIGQIHPGDRVAILVDGVRDPFIGTVSFISPQAEYTPPVIYSQESQEQTRLYDRSDIRRADIGEAASRPAGRRALRVVIMPNDLAIDVRGMTKRIRRSPCGRSRRSAGAHRRDLWISRTQWKRQATFLRMLCGLLRADDGQGTCLGYNVMTQSEIIKRHVGYMTQRFSFYEDLSIAENLDFVARMYLMTNRRAAVGETIGRLGLTERRGQLAGELSGGWKQRLALAACMIHHPKLLLLDEPTAGVDPKARRELGRDS